MNGWQIQLSRQVLDLETLTFQVQLESQWEENSRLALMQQQAFDGESRRPGQGRCASCVCAGRRRFCARVRVCARAAGCHSLPRELAKLLTHATQPGLVSVCVSWR